jgi:hypothetical protein
VGSCVCFAHCVVESAGGGAFVLIPRGAEVSLKRFGASHGRRSLSSSLRYIARAQKSLSGATACRTGTTVSLQRFGVIRGGICVPCRRAFWGGRLFSPLKKSTHLGDQRRPARSRWRSRWSKKTSEITMEIAQEENHSTARSRWRRKSLGLQAHEVRLQKSGKGARCANGERSERSHRRRERGANVSDFASKICRRHERESTRERRRA